MYMNACLHMYRCTHTHITPFPHLRTELMKDFVSVKTRHKLTVPNYKHTAEPQAHWCGVQWTCGDTQQMFSYVDASGLQPKEHHVTLHRLLLHPLLK